MQLLKHRLKPFLVFLALAACGCAALRQMQGDQGLVFNHQLHQSVECIGCHADVAKGAKAGMPEPDTCADCHDSIDDKKPAERRVATLFDAAGVYKAAKVTPLSSEVIYSHKVHVDGKVACSDCHKGIGSSTEITTAVRLTMDDCMSCHAKAKVANECSTCHSEIRQDARPPSHVMQSWRRFHGQQAADADRHEPLNRCTLCHTEESCTSCHRTEAPANHTIAWRQQGHGVAVSMDRDSCKTCHQSDFCASCHRTTAPRNHVGQWSGATQTHCVSCHLPVADERCSVCHTDGTPSHAKALPTPATMIGTDCRSCHGVQPNAKLPHVDNGSNCTYCHR
jgi:hypothetical protein